jgi:vesicle transport through interaction with t-SNAREs protein 1
MSSEMFETIEEEFQTVLTSAEYRLDKKLITCPYGEQRKKLINEMERDLAEAQQLLPQLESEARQAPLPYRAELSSKIRMHRETLGRLNSRFRGILANFNENPRGNADPRQIVLEGRTILERTSDSIARSHAVAIETEQIGTEVVGELGQQRETLQRTKTRLVDTDVEISRSRKILRSMYLNVIYNKLILIGIIILELCILGVVVYMKFK